MILVDTREDSKVKGSPGLWEDLKKTGLPLGQTKLAGGDLMFMGQGPEGKEVAVGVEFKKVNDLLSSIRTKRLQGHQLLEMQDYDFRYLLVEGEWRVNERGVVTLRSGRRDWTPAPGRLSGAELDKTLLGLTLRGGLHVWRCATRRDSIRWIQSLYRDFTDKPWESHSSHLAIYTPKPLVEVSGFRSVVSQFPGIGFKLSAAVEQHFKGSIRRAVKATAMEWNKVDGVGKVGAQRIDQFLE